jgi:hypothetical protein
MTGIGTSGAAFSTKLRLKGDAFLRGKKDMGGVEAVRRVTGDEHA